MTIAELWVQVMHELGKLEGAEVDGSPAWALLRIGERHASVVGGHCARCRDDAGGGVEWPCPDFRDLAAVAGVDAGPD